MISSFAAMSIRYTEARHNIEGTSSSSVSSSTCSRRRAMVSASLCAAALLCSAACKADNDAFIVAKVWATCGPRERVGDEQSGIVLQCKGLFWCSDCLSKRTCKGKHLSMFACHPRDLRSQGVNLCYQLLLRATKHRGGVLEKKKSSPSMTKDGRPTGNHDFEAMKGASDSESE